MRTVLVLIIMIAATGSKAQTFLPGSMMDYNTYRGSFAHTIPMQDSSAKKKWSFSKYAGLSAGYTFFKGGGASVFAAPIGLQVNRQLTNTMYAFAGLSVAPAYIHFNGAMLPGSIGKTNMNNPFLQTNTFGIYSRAEVGLMYVNPQKTFSISGGIGVERSSSPAFYYPVNATRQNNTITPNR